MFPLHGLSASVALMTSIEPLWKEQRRTDTAAVPSAELSHDNEMYTTTPALTDTSAIVTGEAGDAVKYDETLIDEMQLRRKRTAAARQ